MYAVRHVFYWDIEDQTELRTMFNSFISSLAPRAAGQETPALPQGLYGQEPSRWEATRPKNKPLPPLPPDRKRRRKNISNPFFHFLKKDLAPPKNAFQKLKKMLHSSLHRSIKMFMRVQRTKFLCRCMQLDMFFIEIFKIKPNSEPCSTPLSLLLRQEPRGRKPPLSLKASTAKSHPGEKPRGPKTSPCLLSPQTGSGAGKTFPILFSIS